MFNWENSIKRSACTGIRLILLLLEQKNGVSKKRLRICTWRLETSRMRSSIIKMRSTSLQQIKNHRFRNRLIKSHNPNLDDCHRVKRVKGAYSQPLSR